MPRIPMREFEIAHQRLLERGPSHHRKVGTSFILDYKPDGSWEIWHLSNLIYVIDRFGRSEVICDQEGVSLSDRNAINSLSMLVLGFKEIPNVRERKAQDIWILDDDHRRDRSASKESCRSRHGTSADR